MSESEFEGPSSRPTTDPEEPSGSDRAGAAEPGERAGSTIDRYHLRRRLGEGGFGVVWLAEQREPVHRPVALKIIKLGMDTKQVIARFEAERQALAIMDHQGIARVYDAGTTGSGRPYFVMELVDGVSITQFCRERRLSMRERLDLFRDVCAAVHHAHQKGIIHRDIKPSNVMVTMHDGRPTVKVIDFGIAKAVSRRLTERTMFTEHGQFIGTPEYMSPEQAGMRGLDVDTRSDIYALGVLLYELLTGTTPFDSERLRSAGLDEIQRIIREETPHKPSTRLCELAAARRVRDARTTEHAQAMRGDLDWIVMRALEKDRSRRYDSASALADDVARHLRDEPVTAGPPSIGYRLQKLVRRHRGVVAATIALGVLLILGTAGTGIGMVRALRAADRERAALSAEVTAREYAEIQQANAEAVSGFLGRMITSANPERHGPDVTLGALVDQAADDLADGALEDQPLTEAAIRFALGRAYKGLGRYAEAEVQFDRAWILREAELGAVHGDTIDVLTQRGSVARLRGNVEVAERTMRAAVTAAEELDDDPNDRLGVAINNLALLLLDQGDLAEAEAYLERALAHQRMVGADGPVELATTLNNLALVARDRGDLERAESSWIQARDLLEEEYGPDHVHIAAVIESTGSLRLARGDFEEAETMYLEALAMRRRLLPDPHPVIATSLNNLGYLLNAAGDHVAAADVLREAVDMRREVLDPDHPALAGSLGNYSIALTALARHDEAVAAAREGLRIRRGALGGDDPRTLLAMHNLAAALEAGGEFDEALALATEAHDLASLSGGEHPHGPLLAARLGSTLLAQGRAAEAEAFLLEAHADFVTRHGRDHARARAVAGRLVELYETLGRDDDAATWRDRR